MDPFLTLTAAAMSTKTLRLGTGICLVNQRDPIQTAKLVASIDQLSGGRFLFGIGAGALMRSSASSGALSASIPISEKSFCQPRSLGRLYA